MTAVDRKRVSVALVGHKGAGKSTLLGQMLWLLGDVDPAHMKTIEAAATRKDNRASRFAMLIDSEGAEWEQGGTINSKFRTFESGSASLAIVDTPGSPECTRAVVSGMSGAAAIILAVNAHEGHFEEGFAKGGQAREHALLAYVMGVRHVVVAVTHLDSLPTPFSKDRFEECKMDAACYLKRLGFVPERVSCIPVSGLVGDNLVDASTNMPWYTGATLLEALELLDVSQQQSDKPLRVVLFSAEQGESRMVFKGRVVYGTLRSDMTVSFMPGGLTTGVTLLEVHGDFVDEAQAGDIVAFSVTASSLPGVGKGTVVSETNRQPARLARSCIAQLIHLNTPLTTSAGSVLDLDVCTACTPCKVAELHQKVDRRSGKVLEEEATVLKAGDVAFVKLEPQQDVVMEAAADLPLMARFCVRQGSSVVAVGLVKTVEYVPFEPVQA